MSPPCCHLLWQHVICCHFCRQALYSLLMTEFVVWVMCLGLLSHDLVVNYGTGLVLRSHHLVSVGQVNLHFLINLCVFLKIQLCIILMIFVLSYKHKIYYLFLLNHFWQLATCCQLKNSTNILHVKDNQFSHKSQVRQQRKCKEVSECN